MTEMEVARRFGQRAGKAAGGGDWTRSSAERDAFRLWLDLVAPGHACHELRGELEHEFNNGYRECFEAST